MREAEGFRENYFALAHEYDPVKRKEYYERTKKLKGRKGGSSEDGGRTTTSAPGKTPTPTKNDIPAKTAARQARIKAIQERLAHLKDVLADLVEQAKVRSGGEAESDKKKPAEATKAEPKTRQEKQKAAEAARESRKKENPQSESKDEASLRAQVAEVEQKIADVRAKLKAAIAQARNSKQKPKPQPDKAPEAKNPQAPEGRTH